MLNKTTENLSSTAARAQTMARHNTMGTSHQARNLARLSSDIYLHQGDRVYLLDTYSFQGRRIAMVMDVDDRGMYEVFYEQLERL